jgi:hypothetical protein
MGHAIPPHPRFGASEGGHGHGLGATAFTVEDGVTDLGKAPRGGVRDRLMRAELAAHADGIPPAGRLDAGVRHRRRPLGTSD